MVDGDAVSLMGGKVSILIDFKFFLGLIVGGVLTFRYVVVALYHPIIREQEKIIAEHNRHDGETDEPSDS